MPTRTIETKGHTQLRLHELTLRQFFYPKNLTHKMNRSYAFNNYLNGNIRNKTFSESDFLSRPTKRNIENILTFLKGQAYEEYGVFPRSSISLTGPAGRWHARNFKSIHIDHVYVPEYSVPTYNNLVKSIQHSEYENYMTIQNLEFFDYMEELMGNGVMFSDIDFDTTCTIDSVSNELTKFAYTLANKLTNLTPIFTVTITLSNRRTGGRTKQALEQAFVKTLNSIDKLRILDMYFESYKEVCGGPMVTSFYVIGRTSFTSVFDPSLKENPKYFKWITPIGKWGMKK